MTRQKREQVESLRPNMSYSYNMQMPNYVLVESKPRAEDLGRGAVDFGALYQMLVLALSWNIPVCRRIKVLSPCNCHQLRHNHSSLYVAWPLDQWIIWSLDH